MQQNRNLKNRMRELRSYGTVGEPARKCRLYPEKWRQSTSPFAAFPFPSFESVSSFDIRISDFYASLRPSRPLREPVR
jgi:hypothetical protein